MSTGALIFMLVSWAFVLGLMSWSFGKILKGKKHFDPDGIGPAQAKYIYSEGSAYGKRVQCQGGAKNHVVVMPETDFPHDRFEVGSVLYRERDGLVFMLWGAYAQAKGRLLDSGAVMHLATLRPTQPAARITSPWRW